jgi:hypothetical protein
MRFYKEPQSVFCNDEAALFFLIHKSEQQIKQGVLLRFTKINQKKQKAENFLNRRSFFQTFFYLQFFFFTKINRPFDHIFNAIWQRPVQSFRQVQIRPTSKYR